jgi:hypothetical protein
MDLRRLRSGEWVASASGALLLVSLFLPWYGIDGESLSAWESLAVIDVVLALVAALGIALPLVTASQRVPAVPIALAALVTLVGVLGLVLVLARLAALPEGADGREWAIWLALAGVAGVTAGAALGMRDERLSPPGRHTDLTGRPAPPPPEIEAVRPPRPE